MAGATKRVVLYMDVWPGMDLQYATAYCKPVTKIPDAKRYQLVFDIPDPHNPDETIKPTVLPLED